jgi:hypothetical protein
LRDELTDAKESGNTEVLLFYTQLLKLHIEQNLKIPPAAYEIMLHCVKPSYIIDAFDQNLIDICSNHINILFEKEYMFIGIEEMEEYPNAYEVLMTLSILTYKLACKSNRENIVRSINDRLAEFILHEDYDESVRKIAIPKLIETFILNGIMDSEDLTTFLTITCRRFHANNSETEDDMTTDSDSSNSQRNTVGDSLYASTNAKNALLNHFPLSLKNITRIAIKNQLIEYNEFSVMKLELPLIMKKFVLFEDKIREILALSRATV